MCAVAFRTTHGQIKTSKCDTEGFVPVAVLCGVVSYHPRLSDLLLVQPERYDLLYTLTQNEHILPEL